MLEAYKTSTLVPAFNIAHLPMLQPIVNALKDSNTFGLIAVARPDWTKFQAKSIKAVSDEFKKYKLEPYVRLHLDHVPVIDEDNLKVDYISTIGEAIELGYGSVMVDGSRLSLEDNIESTRQVVQLAHKAGIPVEAELGAVLGHEEGPLPPYEELFASGKGFTSPEEAKRFVDETKVDWLSVAIGNIHGAVSKAALDDKKVAARLNIEHLEKISDAIGVPLVLHGGSGIVLDYIKAAIKKGITKINVGTQIRQAYESGMREDSIEKGQQNVYDTVTALINDYNLKNSRDIINQES